MKTSICLGIPATLKQSQKPLPKGHLEQDITVGNLGIRVCGNIAVAIISYDRIKISDAVTYFYDYLEPKCDEIGLDFSSVVVSLYQKIDLDLLIDWR